MQELRLLLISLATVLLSSILLFVYFRTRVSKVEEKLEIMFNLIQSHSQERATNQFLPNDTSVQINKENQERINLIDVSDTENGDSDEDYSDSDDSDYDSESERNELVIGNEMLSEENVKKIALNLENTDVLFNTKNFGNNLESEEIIVKKEAAEDVEEDVVEDVVDVEDVEDVVDVGDVVDVEDVEDVVDVGETIDLSKLKVVELRKMCSEQGKGGYKSLKKSELVELLQK